MVEIEQVEFLPEIEVQIFYLNAYIKQKYQTNQIAFKSAVVRKSYFFFASQSSA